MTRALPSPRLAAGLALLALAVLPAGAQARAKFAVDPQGASFALVSPKR